MVNPAIWGKHGWQFLHYVSVGYPDNPTSEQKKQYKDFYLNIGNVLPCAKCQKNYYRHLQENPLTDTILSSKDNFKNWVIAMHNAVNLENGKDIISFDKADIIIKNDTCQNDLNDIVNDERTLQLSEDIKPPSFPRESFINIQNNDNMYLISIIFIAFVLFLIFRFKNK